MKDLNTNTVTTSNISLASSKEVLKRIRGLQCLTSAATSSGGFVNAKYVNDKIYKPAIKLGQGACTNGYYIHLPQSLLMENVWRILSDE